MAFPVTIHILIGPYLDRPPPAVLQQSLTHTYHNLLKIAPPLKNKPTLFFEKSCCKVFHDSMPTYLTL